MVILQKQYGNIKDLWSNIDNSPIIESLRQNIINSVTLAWENNQEKNFQKNLRGKGISEEARINHFRRNLKLRARKAS